MDGEYEWGGGDFRYYDHRTGAAEADRRRHGFHAGTRQAEPPTRLVEAVLLDEGRGCRVECLLEEAAEVPCADAGALGEYLDR